MRKIMAVSVALFVLAGLSGCSSNLTEKPAGPASPACQEAWAKFIALEADPQGDDTAAGTATLNECESADDWWAGAYGYLRTSPSLGLKRSKKEILAAWCGAEETETNVCSDV